MAAAVVETVVVEFEHVERVERVETVEIGGGVEIVVVVVVEKVFHHKTTAGVDGILECTSKVDRTALAVKCSAANRTALYPTQVDSQTYCRRRNCHPTGC